MQIDRRITNGLAWAGALLVVAIPAADAALRQFSAGDSPQIAVVEEQPVEAPALPTPATQRPEPVEVAETAEEPGVEPEQPDPVKTASVAPMVSGGDAVDSFLRSGKSLPSYISGGDAAPAETAVVKPSGTVVPKPAAVAEPAPESVAVLPRTQVDTFPTPVSERPASVPRSVVATQPPLIVEEPDIVVTADELEDWESGPLSEFLASRQGGSQQVDPEYDADGFFLDEGPNSSARVTRFPRAYGYETYPFE